MKTFGLIGYPLSHSFSAGYFEKKFKREEIQALYENFSIRKIAHFTELVKSRSGLQGLNVTIPYKEEIIAYLDELDPLVRDIGAVNTVKIVHRGNEVRLKGYNTDVPGFERSLGEQLVESQNKALVLGSGGSSKAVVYVLKKLGIEYTRVSRTASEGFVSYEEVTEDLVAEHRLIVNTTPLGMYPDVDSCPGIPYQGISEGHLLFDLVYNPEKTRFLEKGEKNGAKISNGFNMLVYQAEASWKIWNSPGF